MIKDTAKFDLQRKFGKKKCIFQEKEMLFLKLLSAVLFLSNPMLIQPSPTYFITFVSWTNVSLCYWAESQAPQPLGIGGIGQDNGPPGIMAS